MTTSWFASEEGAFGEPKGASCMSRNHLLPDEVQPLIGQIHGPRTNLNLSLSVSAEEDKQSKPRHLGVVKHPKQHLEVSS
uniref:Uncharacterized protein n=1 Tax=Sphaerodactylus townsendi TaxID=933632 RepID=A0ACB8E8S9_9SAUR